jgi:hypothetical protein
MKKRTIAGLVCLVSMLVLGAAAAPVAFAATTTISDQASCEAYGGTWLPSGAHFECDLSRITVAAGDTLIINKEAVISRLTNDGTVELNDFIAVDELVNNVGGVLDLGGTGRVSFTLGGTNDGAINVSTGLTLFRGVLTNNGTITLRCGGSIE